MGGVPCAIVHEVGGGRTCYLNLEMGKHTTARLIAVADFHRDLASALMTWAGVKPAVQAQPLLKDGRIYAHADGDARYIGYVRPQAEPEIRTLVIAEPRHVYDCQDGTYFGLTSRFTAKAADRAADVFALLPYKVTGLSLAAAKATRRGERLAVPVVLHVEGGIPLRHVVHVAVLEPDGVAADHYSQNVVVTGGNAVFEIPFALNDPLGVWTLKARDAATGVSGQCRIALER